MTYAEAAALFARLGEPVPTAGDPTRAYRRLALRHHPDRGGTTALMAQISAAYAILKRGRPQATAIYRRPPRRVHTNPVWRAYQWFDDLDETRPDLRFFIFMGLLLPLLGAPLVATFAQLLFGLSPDVTIWGTVVEMAGMMALVFSRMYWVEVVSRR